MHNHRHHRRIYYVNTHVRTHLNTDMHDNSPHRANYYRSSQSLLPWYCTKYI